MVAKNDITGAEIKSRHSSNAYLENYDRIFNEINSCNKDKVFIIDNPDDKYVNIIVDSTDNMNCQLRLNPSQFQNLLEMLKEYY